MHEQITTLVDRLLAEVTHGGNDYKNLTLRWLLAEKLAALQPTDSHVAQADTLRDMALKSLAERFKDDKQVYYEAVRIILHPESHASSERWRALEAMAALHRKYQGVPTDIFTSAWDAAMGMG